MNKSYFIIEENNRIAKDIYKMVLVGDTSHITSPGQFVNIALDGFYLSRPISVCDCVGERLTIIYKSVGKGTEYMSKLQKDDGLDLLCGLGNGYDISKAGKRPLLVGGGVGVPPLYMLAKKLVSAGAKPVAILGFNSAEDVFGEDAFKEICESVFVTTADGSYGQKGFVTDVLKEAGDCSYIYTCGPQAMLKALYFASDTDGQYSFEERMGCGFGACMGCTCKTKYGNKRICKDGPVLTKEEIIW